MLSPSFMPGSDLRIYGRGRAGRAAVREHPLQTPAGKRRHAQPPAGRRHLSPPAWVPHRARTLILQQRHRGHPLSAPRSTQLLHSLPTKVRGRVLGHPKCGVWEGAGSSSPSLVAAGTMGAARLELAPLPQPTAASANDGHQLLGCNLHKLITCSMANHLRRGRGS